MKIYTRSGDDGTTSLPGGRRVAKCHPRVEAFGSVDELISWIGLLRGCSVNEARKEILVYIQEQLMICAYVLAAGTENIKKPDCSPDNDSALRLEKEIDLMEEKLPPVRKFVLPGGNLYVSYCHIARCVCRRAERAALSLSQTDKLPDMIIKFLNRLSDYLYVLARTMSLELDNEEIVWSV